MAETEKMDISYIGPIFKKYRVDANRTQEEVAEKVGITARFLMAFNLSLRMVVAKYNDRYALSRYILQKRLRPS